MKDDSLSDVAVEVWKTANTYLDAQDKLNKVIQMKDCVGIDTMTNAVDVYHKAVEKVNKATDKEVWAGDGMSVYEREIYNKAWNAAIEAAANVSEINSAEKIRRLKK